MPGASAATQSSRRGSSPNEPCAVSATMRDTSASSTNTSNGNRTLRRMSSLLARICALRRPGLALGSGRGGLGLGFGDRADHVKRAFGPVVELVVQDAFAAVERIRQAHKLALQARELFGGEKRLRQKAFQPARPRDHLAVGRRQLLETKHRDDVLQLRV